MINEDFLEPTLRNYKKILIPCIAIELAIRVAEKDKPIVESFLLDTLSRIKIHTMFTNKGVSDIADVIFSTVVIREFMLSLTQIYLIEITGNIGIEDRSSKHELIKILSKSIDANIEKWNSTHIKKPGGKEYFPEPAAQVYDFIYLNGNSVAKLLNGNDWLILVLMIHLSFEEVSQVLAPVAKT